MNCNQAENISMLIDGELSAEESEKIRAHLANCKDCQNLDKDFLFLRNQLQTPLKESVVKTIELPIFRKKKKKSFSKEGVFLPVPVVGLVILIVISLGVWFFVKRPNSSAKINTVNQTKQKTDSINESLLSRFDKGGRVEIYVVRQQAKNKNEN